MVTTRATGDTNRVDGMTASVTGDTPNQRVAHPVRSNRPPPARGNRVEQLVSPDCNRVNDEEKEALRRRVIELEALLAQRYGDAKSRSQSLGYRKNTEEVTEERRSVEVHRELPLERVVIQRDPYHAFKDFLGCKPPEFCGGSDPTVSLRWLRDMERIFEVCKCAEKDKVKFATHMLKDKAEDWWDYRSTTLGSAVVCGMTWNIFKQLFTENYYTKRDRLQMEKDFLYIKKGKMSIDKYAELFVEKLRFARRLAPDEESCVTHFVEGLPYEYQNLVQRATTLNAAIQEAKTVEDDLRVKEEEDRNKGEKRKFGGSSGPFIKFKNSHQSKKPGEAVMGKVDQKCVRCNSYHTGECTMVTQRCFSCGRLGHLGRDCQNKDRVCFTCEEPGHFSSNCPKKGNVVAGKPAQPKAKGRAFQMTDEEAREIDDKR